LWPINIINAIEFNLVAVVEIQDISLSGSARVSLHFTGDDPNYAYYVSAKVHEESVKVRKMVSEFIFIVVTCSYLSCVNMRDIVSSGKVT